MGPGTQQSVMGTESRPRPDRGGEAWLSGSSGLWPWLGDGPRQVALGGGVPQGCLWGWGRGGDCFCHRIDLLTMCFSPLHSGLQPMDSGGLVAIG